MHHGHMNTVWLIKTLNAFLDKEWHVPSHIAFVLSLGQWFNVICIVTVKNRIYTHLTSRDVNAPFVNARHVHVRQPLALFCIGSHLAVWFPYSVLVCSPSLCWYVGCVFWWYRKLNENIRLLHFAFYITYCNTDGFYYSEKYNVKRKDGSNSTGK